MKKKHLFIIFFPIIIIYSFAPKPKKIQKIEKLDKNVSLTINCIHKNFNDYDTIKTILTKKDFVILEQGEVETFLKAKTHDFFEGLPISQKTNVEYIKNWLDFGPKLLQVLDFNILYNDSLIIKKFEFSVSYLPKAGINKFEMHQMHDSLIAKNDKQLLLKCMIDSVTEK